MYLKKSYVYISLGSNINPIKNIKLSINSLNNIPKINVMKVSSLYKTSPYGNITNQPDYINAVLFLNTQLSPNDLLYHTQLIEKQYGRIRKENLRWGPRTLDIDILLFDKLTIKSKHLTIPHYDIINRIFVIIPLLEISPKVCLPNGKIISSELKKFDLKKIIKIKTVF